MPCLVRWPGVIKPGTIINDIVSHEDWVPTLMAAAGEPNVKEKLLSGYDANGKSFKVHLDGYNQTDLLSGNGPGARKEFFYFTDDGDLAGLRYGKWKMVFLAQEAHGLDVWPLPLTPLRFPFLIDLHADPFERAPEESGGYERWSIDRAYALVPAQALVGRFLQTFKEFPPRQKPASFSVDQALEAMQRRTISPRSQSRLARSRGRVKGSGCDVKM